MTDEELEELIRDVERQRPSRSLPELDAPLGPEVARAIVERFSDAAPAPAPLPEPANRRGWWVTGAVVAVAAALLLAVLAFPTTGPVPSYSLTGRTGISDVRSIGDALVHTDQAPVHLLLRPSTRTSRVPEVRVFSDAGRVPSEVQAAPSGALDVTLGSLQPGAHTLRVELWVDADEPAQVLSVDVEAR